MKISYYDIGVNAFCRQFKDPAALIKNSLDRGVSCILTGTGMETNKKVSAFTLGQEQVYGTVGIHPHNADQARKEDFEALEQYVLSNKNIVAIGECGLDFDRNFSTRDNQIRCFEKHIVLAEKLNKPLFLHERSAAREFIGRFKHHQEICKTSVVHCFTGDIKTLEQYLEMGFYIGITGWICDDRRGKELREAVRIIPPDRILLETDAPYLTPKNIPGLPNVNVPENIVYVAKELAKHMKMEEEVLIAKARANTKLLFQL